MAPYQDVVPRRIGVSQRSVGQNNSNNSNGNGNGNGTTVLNNGSNSSTHGSPSSGNHSTTPSKNHHHHHNHLSSMASPAADHLPLYSINNTKRWAKTKSWFFRPSTTRSRVPVMSLPARILGTILFSLFTLYHITYTLPAYNYSSIDYCGVAEASKQHLFQLQSLDAATGDTTTSTTTDTDTSTTSTTKTFLPKIIHHQWKDSTIPPKYTDWYKAWFDLFPTEDGYTHMHWSDEAGRKLIEDHYAWFLPTYDAYDYNIKRVDVVRYFALYHYGGIHGDLDYEPMINFYDYLPQDRVAVVESPYQYYEATQNSLMASPKGDEFWPRVFKQLDINKNMSVMEATGPKLLDTVMLQKPAQQLHKDVHILPCENFQRIPLGETHVSPLKARFHKEILGRLYPMKQCGDFSDMTCQFARHHCSAAYLEETGLWDLLFKKG